MTHGYKLVQRFKFNDGADGGDGSNANDDQNTNPPGGDGGNGNGDDGQGNKPKPTDREAELLKEVMKRKDDLKSAKAEADALKNQLKKFEGIDLEQVQALLNEKAQREQAELEKRGEFDRVKEQMVTEHTKTLETVKGTYESQIAELSGKLNETTSVITELTIGRAFGDSGYVRDTLTLTPAKARVVYGSHFELQDGKVVAYDKPAGAANRTVLVDGMGEPLSFDAAIEKIVKADPDHEHLVRSKAKAGAGSKNDTDGKAAVKVGSGRDRIGAAIAGGALKR